MHFIHLLGSCQAGNLKFPVMRKLHKGRSCVTRNMNTPVAKRGRLVDAGLRVYGNCRRKWGGLSGSHLLLSDIQLRGELRSSECQYPVICTCSPVLPTNQHSVSITLPPFLLPCHHFTPKTHPCSFYLAASAVTLNATHRTEILFSTLTFTPTLNLIFVPFIIL